MNKAWITLATVCVASSIGSAASAMDENEFLQVELTCPPAKGGDLVVINENVQGTRDRVIITFKNDRPVAVRAATAAKGEAFEDYITITDVTGKLDPSEREFADTVIGKFAGQHSSACFGTSEQRQKSARDLVGNREKLRLAQ